MEFLFRTLKKPDEFRNVCKCMKEKIQFFNSFLFNSMEIIYFKTALHLSAHLISLCKKEYGMARSGFWRPSAMPGITSGCGITGRPPGPRGRAQATRKQWHWEFGTATVCRPIRVHFTVWNTGIAGPACTTQMLVYTSQC